MDDLVDMLSQASYSTAWCNLDGHTQMTETSACVFVEENLNLAPIFIRLQGPTFQDNESRATHTADILHAGTMEI